MSIRHATRLAIPLIALLGTTAAAPTSRPPLFNQDGVIDSAEWLRIVDHGAKGGEVDLGNQRVTFQRRSLQAERMFTIRGGIFTEMTLDRWRNVRFVGSRFEPLASPVAYQPYILAFEPDNLHLDGVRMRGDRNAAGNLDRGSVSIRGGANVSIRRSTFTDMSNFAAFLRTRDVTVEDCDFTNIREGIMLIGVDGAVVRRNLIGPFDPAAGDHADGVQMFTAGLNRPGDHGARNVMIEDNLILAGPGARAQGIFLRDEAGLYRQGRGYADIRIHNNVLIGTGWRGISSVDPVDRMVVNGNRLLVVLGGDKVSGNWVKLGGPQWRIPAEVIDNVGHIWLEPGVIDRRNKQAKPSRPADVTAAIAAWRQRYRTMGQAGRGN